MYIKAISCLLVLAVLFLVPPRPAFAGTGQTKKNAKAAKVREKIRKLGTGENVSIKVELYNDTVYRGYLKEAGEDSFFFVERSY